MDKASTGHYLYDGSVLFADGERRIYSEWALNDTEAKQRFTRRAAIDRIGVQVLYVEHVIKR